MATTIDPIEAYQHNVQVYDVVFDTDPAVIIHSMESSLLKVTIIPTSGSLALPGVTFDNDNQLTLTPGVDDGSFRIYIEPEP